MLEAEGGIHGGRWDGMVAWVDLFCLEERRGL